MLIIKPNAFNLIKLELQSKKLIRVACLIASISTIISFCFILTASQTKPEVTIISTSFLIVFIFSYTFFKTRFTAEKALRESESHYRNLVEITPLAIIVHQEGKIVYANPMAVRLTGAENYEALIGKPELELIPSQYHLSELERISKVLQGEVYNSIEKKIITFSGDIIDVEVSNILVNHKGRPAVMCLFHDIPEHKKIAKKLMEAESKRLRNAAYHDALTRLPNRYLLNNYIDEILSLDTNTEFAVLFLDLDNFKNVNDTLGHSLGDLILCTAARRLENCVREDDIIARYGGDEFIIILTNVKEQAIKTIAERIIEEFSNPFAIHGNEVFISPSIGISLYPQDGDNVETLLKNADVAMYCAKDNGKNNYRFFTPKLNESHLRKLELENGLRKALQNNEFILHYQPLVDLITGDIFALEALIRWEHPVLGMIPPSEFIPIAEENGLINPIGEWVTRTACKQNKCWQEQGLRKIPISINVSAYQLQNSNFVEIVKNSLSYSDLDPHYLIVEFTESVMQDSIKSCEIVKELKSLGILVAIDDFGTGYSSLSLLKNLPIDILKIDSYFIKDIHTNPNTLEIIKLIFNIGYTLNFNIIVEGIENEYQARVMKENKCKFAQGYFFSRPLPESQARNYMLEYELL